MKKNKVMLAMVLATGMLFGACGSKEANESTDATEMTTEHQTAINTTDAYICPMHCENSGATAPGLCAVCGMDLVANPDFAGETMMTDDTTATEAMPMEEDHSMEEHSEESH